jgi:hypothetical protein
MSDNIDKLIIPLTIMGVAAVGLIALATSGKEISEAISDTISSTTSDTITGVKDVIIGRESASEDIISSQNGQVLINQPCVQDSDCSQSMTTAGQGGDMFSRVGCLSGRCDVRNQNVGGLGNFDDPKGSKKTDTQIEAEKQVGTYEGDYRTVGFGKSCISNLDCAGNGVAGNAPDENRTGCCQGECKQLRKDWFGINVCPNICRAGPFDKPGSCSGGSAAITTKDTIHNTTSGGADLTTTSTTSSVSGASSGFTLGKESLGLTSTPYF